MVAGGEVRAAAVLCHAHPLHGGMMHFKVVFRAAKALQSRGVAVLRFNFRGVGRSEGTFDDGVGEQEDAGAALDALERRFPDVPLWLGGFSFGAMVAMNRAMTDERVAAAFALGFPVRLAGEASFLATRTIPRLFVQGAEDLFGDGATLTRLAGMLVPPPTLHVLVGADHFFTGRLDEVEMGLADWAGDLSWRTP